MIALDKAGQYVGITPNGPGAHYACALHALESDKAATVFLTLDELDQLINLLVDAHADALEAGP